MPKKTVAVSCTMPKKNGKRCGLKTKHRSRKCHYHREEGITVGILAYNDLSLLEFTCNSLWKNTRVPLEVYVIDNSPEKVHQEEIKEWCESILKEKDKPLTYESYVPNRFIPASFNIIVKNAKYDYIFLADDDMYFLPNWDILMSEMGEKGNWRAPNVIEPKNLGSRIAIIKSYGDTPHNFNEPKIIEDFKDRGERVIRRGSFLPALVRRDDYFRMGGYNEEFRVGEAEFGWRAFQYYKSLGKEMLTHPHSYIYHFRNNGGKIRRPGWWQEEGQKLERYMNEKYDITARDTNSHKNMDKIIGHYEIIKEYNKDTNTWNKKI